MTIQVHLRVDEHNRVQAYLNEKPIAEAVALDHLLQMVRTGREESGRSLWVPETTVHSPVATIQDPLGQRLFQSLGGPTLLSSLETDPDSLLLLHIDPPAETVPWERATLPEGDLLAIAYSVARVVNRPVPSLSQSQAVSQLLVLTADPLVDEWGRPRRARLDFEAELKGLRQALAEANVGLTARRVPPTRGELQAALRQGPAILHLAAHGTVNEKGPWLLLEDKTGGPDRLSGHELIRLAPRGYLRLVVLAACLTAAGGPTQRLARALVEKGAPAVVGMQGTLPDSLAPAFARHFYAALFQGLPLPEALRQARLAMHDDALDLLKGEEEREVQAKHLAALPVLYLAQNVLEAFPLPQGQPAPYLNLPGRVALPEETISAPTPFLGREEHLHGLARLYQEGHRVITLTGTAGVGKTALAAAFARRFAWYWLHGVVGYSFAPFEEQLPPALAFAQALGAAALGPEAAQTLTRAADLPGLLRERGWQGLLVLDNYETVLQALEEEGRDGPAHRIHRLVYRLAEDGHALLLTSRQQPAGLPGETTYPRHGHLLGLPEAEAAALFVYHSQRAKGLSHEKQTSLARQVAQATEGHPLAIRLLAHEFDHSLEVMPEAFLTNWAEELQQAEVHGLPHHHRTFTAALDRTYRRLDPETQRRARLLALYPFPFLAEAAALAWHLRTAEAAPDAKAARSTLSNLHQRGLLEVTMTFAGSDVPRVFRLLPPVREALRARLTPDEETEAQQALAAYGAWLARRAYGAIHYDLALAQLVRESMPALDAAVATLEGIERLWHIQRTAWLKKAYGDYDGALELLQPYDRELPAAPDEEVRRAYSSLWYELAGIYATRGDLDRALRLYQQSLDIDDRLGDQKGKAATLHEMAYIYRLRGDLDRALHLYQQNLDILERLGDQRGKAATLHAMAYIYRLRGDLDRALRLYQQSLDIFDRLGDQKGKAATLVMMGQVLASQGHLTQALEYYMQGLNILDRLGDQRGKAMTLGMLGQLLFAQGQHAEGIHAVLEGYLILQVLDIDPQGRKTLEEVLAQMRREAGPQVFDPIWAELTQGAPLPEWLTTTALTIPAEALPPEWKSMLQALVAEQGDEVSLEDLPPEAQEALKALLALLQAEPWDQAALQGVALYQAVRQGAAPLEQAVEQLQTWAQQAREGESPGSPWLDVATLFEALAARLEGQEAPPVPERYVDLWKRFVL